tara:strand:+ start:406 stop:711 length:306 start_codon:yes stop_codon:yes gene_type:complete
MPDQPEPEFEPLPDGLEGYWWETDYIVIPWIAARKPRVFLSWLRAIEKRGKPVFFPTVINERLATLLKHRGYVSAVTYAGEPFNEDVTGLLKPLADTAGEA